MSNDFNYMYPELQGYSQHDRYDRLLPIDYDIYVPIEYWKRGANIIPSVVNSRVGQMQLFYQLYQGDYRAFLGRANVVRMNYHKMTTSFVGSLMMMYPPEITIAGSEDLPVTGRFIQQLNRALRGVIADMVRYGTGLFRVQAGQWGSEIVNHQPVYWYPVDGQSDTLAVASQDKVELWHDIGLGEVRYDRYSVPNRAINSASKPTELGDLEETITEQYGDEAQWDVIQSLTLGRPGLIINTIADVPSGDWGESIYPDLTPLALEVTHRLTQNKGTLDEHGNPVTVFYPSDVGSGGMTHEDFVLGADKQHAELQLNRTLDMFNAWRTRRITNLPDGYDDVKYLEWTGDLTDHFNQITKCEELLFAATRLPAAFFNIGPNGLPPSGVALMKQFIRTHAYIRDLVSTLQDSITRAVLIGSMLNGASAQELEGIYDNLEIEWETVFDETSQAAEDISPDVDPSEGDDSATTDPSEEEV